MAKDIISEQTTSKKVDQTIDVVKADGDRVRFEVAIGGAAIFKYHDPTTGRVIPIKLVSSADDTEPAVCRIAAREGSTRVECEPTKSSQVKCLVEEKDPKVKK